MPDRIGVTALALTIGSNGHIRCENDTLVADSAGRE
jgi:hypothetical protein